MGGKLLLEPLVPVPSAPQVLGEQPPVADDHQGQTGLFRVFPHLPGGGGLEGGVGEDGQLAVGLQHGGMDFLQVGVAQDAQFLQQLVQGQAVGPQGLLHHLPLAHYHAGAAPQEGAEPDGLGGENGEDGGNGQQHRNGNDPGQQGNAVVLHGDAGQVGDDEGQGQLAGFQLPQLPLAQQTNARHQENVEHQRANEYHKHGNTSGKIWFIEHFALESRGISLAFVHNSNFKNDMKKPARISCILDGFAIK